MTLQTCVTLVVVGALTGVVATIAGKKKTGLGANLMLAIGGAFLGWFVFHNINRVAIEVFFAIGGGLLLIWMVGLVKK